MSNYKTGSEGPGSAPGPAIAVLLKGYPRLSETFIAQEIRGLERRGLQLRLYSLRQPTDPEVHPVHREITAPVVYLPEYLRQEPQRVLTGWLVARRLAGYRRARTLWLADLRRDPSPNRGRRFGQACVLAAELPADVGHLYAHFLHTPASVARYAAVMRGLSWSASAHAKDIWTTPDWEKREKLAEMAWLTVCTAAAQGHLAGLLRDRPEIQDKIHLIYHGLDLDRFAPPEAARAGRSGNDPKDPMQLLSVGRAVVKKGYPDLLQALASLPPEIHWRLTHIGGGPLASILKAQARQLGIAERITWRGPQPQAEVLAAYRAADLFVLASRIADDGDRDGLPNVLLEAQSQGLACVSTPISGIPELIRDGETGLLVPTGDSPALAAAVARLIRDPELRRWLAEAGARTVARDFSAEQGLDRVARLLAPTPALVA